ncbi:uncharacterized protein LOC144449826 [Glandiceps talaboti]
MEDVRLTTTTSLKKCLRLFKLASILVFVICITLNLCIRRNTYNITGTYKTEAILFRTKRYCNCSVEPVDISHSSGHLKLKDVKCIKYPIYASEGVLHGILSSDDQKQTGGYDCVQSLHPQTWQKDKLKPYTKTVVPNIAHYTWFGDREFRFDHFISVLSAYRIMKADKIMFHTDYEPHGRYWNEAKTTIPILEVVFREAPKLILGNSLTNNAHKSDVARLEILMEHGGIYMDLDVIVVQSLDSLRYYDFVLGRETYRGLNNGIIVASKKSLFLKLFYEGYHIYQGKCWNCDSILFPNELAKINPHLIHIEESSLVQPSHEYPGPELIFNGHLKWWTGHYTIHTWIRVIRRRYWSLIRREEVYTPQNIKTLDSTFGEICRYVYYNETGPWKES